MFSTSFVGMAITAVFINFLCQALFGYPIIYCLGAMVAQQLIPWFVSVHFMMGLWCLVAYGWDGPRAVRGPATVWVSFLFIPTALVGMMSFHSTCALGKIPALSQRVVEHKPITAPKYSGGLIHQDVTVVDKNTKPLGVENPRDIPKRDSGRRETW